VELGSKIADVFDDGSGAAALDNVTDGSSNGTVGPVAEAKIWLEPQGGCTTSGGSSWQLYSWWDHWNGKWDYPPMAFEGGNLGAGWNGSAYDSRGDSGRWVPCGTPDPGGGLWFLDMDFQAANRPSGWTVVDQSAWDEHSPVSMAWTNPAPCPNTIGNANYWSPPLPGFGTQQGKPWYRETWADDTNLLNCGQANSQGIVSALYMMQDTEVAYERGTNAHVGFPRTGTCTASSYPDGCLSVSPNPSSSWCVTATCVYNLFASGDYPNLKQFVNSSVGNGNPPGLVAVPDCSGLTVSACQSALSAAGFTNTTTTTLTEEQADLSKAGGAVVTTNPAAGANTDTATSITLNINPDPLPSPTEVALDNPQTTKTETTAEILSQCGTPLWHYSDATSAAQIYGSNSLISSDDNPPFPSGAYSSTIAPVQPGWTQSTLSAHLFQDSSKASSAWVLFCSNQNPQFTTPVPGALVGPPEPGDPAGSGQSDYWYAPAPGGQLVIVYPQAWGPTGLPPS